MTERYADYTLKEAAERLGLQPDVLRVYVHRGKINATKRGSMWFFTPDDLANYPLQHGPDIQP